MSISYNPEPTRDLDDAGASIDNLSRSIAQLARDASIEINVQDLKDLEASRRWLPRGKKVYVSCLPKQTWQETEEACRILVQAGFDAIPHVPVRLLPDESTLDRLLANLTRDGQVREILLIAGDYPEAAGPYRCVADVLQSGLLNQHGVQRVSVGGHPEGHPKVALDEIRRAEREKALIVAQLGLELTFVTQFFFEATPFLNWVGELRAAGARAAFVAGLAGPARITTLLKYAARCGVGPSIRALGTHSASLVKIMGDHGPQRVIRALVEDRNSGAPDFNGLHLFCFGGYLRTCEWLHRVANGRFKLNDSGGFEF
jgi:methylenetetrahydrofolate reductase (NADPH)